MVLISEFICSAIGVSNVPAVFLRGMCISVQLMVQLLAPMYGVDSEFATEVVRRESEWNIYAVGDDGDAVGLWQFHKPAFETGYRLEYGAEVDWSAPDMRLDPEVSTRVALRLIQEGYVEWWTAARQLMNEGQNWELAVGVNE